MRPLRELARICRRKTPMLGARCRRLSNGVQRASARRKLCAQKRNSLWSKLKVA